jgi:hypothetical protein
VINEFLTFAGLKDATGFFHFFEGFKNSRYLYTYAETQQIAYALKRICMRVWKDPFTPAHQTAINTILTEYRVGLLDGFMTVFYDIDGKLIFQP